MKYRLNLYAERFRPKRILLNRWVLASSVGLFTLLSIVGGAGLSRVNYSLTEQHRLLSVQQMQLQTRMLELSKRVQARSENELLHEAIAEQTRDIASKRQMLNHLIDSPLLTEIRFSQFMQGLSNSHVQGLWLTRVRADGNNLILDGSSLSEELVPQWIHRLSSQADFRGKTFSALELTRPQDSPMPHLDFHLSTQLLQGDGNNG